MTDRELLEKAAKAAGLKVLARPAYAWPALAIAVEEDLGYDSWDPLNYDDDAFRLACDLRLEVHPRWRFVEVHNGVEIIIEDCEDEPALRYAATRRAIVRAAAALVFRRSGG